MYDGTEDLADASWQKSHIADTLIAQHTYDRIRLVNTKNKCVAHPMFSGCPFKNDKRRKLCNSFCLAYTYHMKCTVVEIPDLVLYSYNNSPPPTIWTTIVCENSYMIIHHYTDSIISLTYRGLIAI